MRKDLRSITVITIIISLYLTNVKNIKIEYSQTGPAYTNLVTIFCCCFVVGNMGVNVEDAYMFCREEKVRIEQKKSDA